MQILLSDNAGSETYVDTQPVSTQSSSPNRTGHLSEAIVNLYLVTGPFGRITGKLTKIGTGK